MEIPAAGDGRHAMKLLLVQDYLRSGGTERQTVLLANAFAAAGHDTTLLTFRPGGPLAALVGSAVRRRALQPLDLRLDWLAPGLGRTAAAEAPEVALCMGRMANCRGSTIQRAIAAARPGAAAIATLRSGKPPPWLFRCSLRAVRHVIANSCEARDGELQRSDTAAGKITVIPNAMVFPPTGQGRRETGLRARFGATAKTFILLNVAMFRPEKNQRELIEIATGLPEHLDWQLWLAGDGPTRSACERLAASRPLGTRVRFIGYRRDPTPLYRAADCAVHASWSESLSNFLIEAQAHGLLAVACEARGLRECCIPGRTGWIIAGGDRRAFRATLTRRMSEPTSARTARAADARTFARRNFDPARQVAAHLDLFRSLVPLRAP